MMSVMHYKFNAFHNYTGVCEFSDGYVLSDNAEQIGTADTDNECAILVFTTRPSALGVTWYADGSNECYAESGGLPEMVDYENDYRMCMFPGKYRGL